MTPKRTPMPPIQAVKKPTEQELAEQRNRALRQKMMSLAEAAYIALAGNPACISYDPKDIADRAFALAETWMGEFYGLRKKEDTPEK